MSEQVDFLLCPFTGSRCQSRCALALSLDGKRVCGLNALLFAQKGKIESVSVAPTLDPEEVKKKALRKKLEYIQSHPDEFR